MGPDPYPEETGYFFSAGIAGAAAGAGAAFFASAADFAAASNTSIVPVNNLTRGFGAAFFSVPAIAFLAGWG